MEKNGLVFTAGVIVHMRSSITQNLGNRIFHVKLFVHDRLLLSPVRITFLNASTVYSTELKQNCRSSSFVCLLGKLTLKHKD